MDSDDDDPDKCNCMECLEMGDSSLVTCMHCGVCYFKFMQDSYPDAERKYLRLSFQYYHDNSSPTSVFESSLGKRNGLTGWSCNDCFDLLQNALKRKNKEVPAFELTNSQRDDLLTNLQKESKSLKEQLSSVVQMLSHPPLAPANVSPPRKVAKVAWPSINPSSSLRNSYSPPTANQPSDMLIEVHLCILTYIL